MICYTSDKLNTNEFRYQHLNKSSRDLEMQWISVEHTNMRRIVVINVYRPPQGDYKKACKLIHDSIAEANLKDNAEVFLLGDFNIDLNDRKSPMVKELESTTTYWGLKSCITSDTRFGVVNGVLKKSRIDNIFTNSDFTAFAGTLDWNFSDHLAIAIKRKRVRLQQDKVAFTGRSYKNYNKEDLQLELLLADWQDYFASADPDFCWDFLENLVKQYLDRVCPQKIFKIRVTREPWVTNEILEEIKDKDRWLRVAKRTGKAEDFIQAKLARNQVGRLIQQAKADFLMDQQRELADDPKKFWRVIKSIVPDKKAKLSKIVLIDKPDGEPDFEIDNSTVANHINQFFINIGPKLAAKHKKKWRFYGNRILDKCPLFQAEFDRVLALCKDIKVSKSSGFDDISTRVFKDAFLALIPQLVHLFNLSFESGIFPDRWKRATIIPLFKGGDKTEVSNYRPISLLPLPGKLLEKIVHGSMMVFLNRLNVITDRQGGFRKGFSTSTSIVELTNNLFNNINLDYTSLAAFIDLRKAFDTVNHDILIKKLGYYGIRDGNLKWCANYLTNRSQRTLANGVISDNDVVTCGVPQGSVLGPLFFILYVNDIQGVVRNANLQLYADDTVIHVAGIDAQSAANKLQPELNKFSVWCTENKLSLMLHARKA